MNSLRRLAAVLLLALFAHSAEAAQHYSERMMFRIEVPMEAGASVIARSAANDSRQAIGTVEALPVKTRWPSYTASAWGEPGAVCASAVNAVHMLVAVEKGKGRTLSIIPKETIAPAAGPGASIIISTKAGEGLFGAWAPPVGSSVMVRKASGAEKRLSPDFMPQKGDTLVISAMIPAPPTPGAPEVMPYIVDIENRPGGRVTAWTESGADVIGRILLPVSGTGRFEGTKFQRVGAVRANHCGVIDISTSKYGQIGGFQIIPWDHALSSKEMQNAWNMTQWMLVAPSDGKSKLGATFPLFKAALVSGPADGEKLWDVWSTYGRKSLIMVRRNGGAWQKMPESAGRKDAALKDVTHIRIYYPFTGEPMNHPFCPKIRQITHGFYFNPEFSQQGNTNNTQ